MTHEQDKPVNVRNFWLEGDIDGRSSKISGGPRAKDGGFFLRVFIRDQGEVAEACHLTGHVAVNGELQLSVTCTDSRFRLGASDQQAHLLTQR